MRMTRAAAAAAAAAAAQIHVDEDEDLTVGPASSGKGDEEDEEVDMQSDASAEDKAPASGKSAEAGADVLLEGRAPLGEVTANGAIGGAVTAPAPAATAAAPSSSDPVAENRQGDGAADCESEGGEVRGARGTGTKGRAKSKGRKPRTVKTEKEEVDDGGKAEAIETSSGAEKVAEQGGEQAAEEGQDAGEQAQAQDQEEQSQELDDFAHEQGEENVLVDAPAHGQEEDGAQQMRQSPVQDEEDEDEEEHDPASALEQDQKQVQEHGTTVSSEEGQTGQTNTVSEASATVRPSDAPHEPATETPAESATAGASASASAPASTSTSSVEGAAEVLPTELSSVAIENTPQAPAPPSAGRLTRRQLAKFAAEQNPAPDAAITAQQQPESVTREGQEEPLTELGAAVPQAEHHVQDIDVLSRHHEQDSVEKEHDLLAQSTAPVDMLPQAQLAAEQAYGYGVSPATEPAELDVMPLRTPAKNFMAKDLDTMRSTSNKENEQPLISTTAPVPIKEPSEPLPAEIPQELGLQQVEDGMATTESQKATPEETKAVSPTATRPSTSDSSKKSSRPSSAPRTKPTASSATSATSKKPPVARGTTKAATVARASLSSVRKPPSTKPVPEPKTTSTTLKRTTSVKKPAARPSSVHQPAARPSSVHQPISRPSSMHQSTSRPSSVHQPSARPTSVYKSTSRPSSVHQPTARPSSVHQPTARPSSVHHARQQSEAPKTEEQKAASLVNIPHSKPRPMSISFPTPPPPPKSTRPPTKSTFQLPGEAIAAKLKAAKLERTKKEEEEEEQTKRREFKARPAPKFKDAASAQVRHNAASRARESLMLGKDATGSADNKTASSSGIIRRATSVRETTIRPKPAHTKRLSTAVKPTAARTDTPVTSAVPKQQPSTSTTTTTVPAAAHKPRATSTTHVPTHPPAPANPATTGAGTKKGKEVFSRAFAEKEALEKQKRDKEEAARKARADAAERGRLASREWAARMKAKAGGKLKPAASAGVAVSAVNDDVDTPRAAQADDTAVAVVTEAV